ncbi:MAG: hypothetical protein V7760_11645 [Marinobacter sp.]
MNEALPDLRALFHFRLGLFRKERVDVPVFELDSFGCVLKSDKVFEPGDPIILDLVMTMPVEEIRAQGINGVIIQCRKHSSNFFYSIEFVDPDPQKNPYLNNRLSRIRSVLTRKQSIRSRRSSGHGAAL